MPKKPEWEPVEPLQQFVLEREDLEAYVIEDAEHPDRWNWRIEPTEFTDDDDEEYASGFFEGPNAEGFAYRAAEAMLDLLLEYRG